MNIQLYTIPDSWSPPEWTKCNYDISLEDLNKAHEDNKQLDPKRFKKLLPQNYSLFQGGYI